MCCPAIIRIIRSTADFSTVFPNNKVRLRDANFIYRNPWSNFKYVIGKSRTREAARQGFILNVRYLLKLYFYHVGNASTSRQLSRIRREIDRPTAEKIKSQLTERVRAATSAQRTFDEFGYLTGECALWCTYKSYRIQSRSIRAIFVPQFRIATMFADNSWRLRAKIRSDTLIEIYTFFRA